VRWSSSGTVQPPSGSGTSGTSPALSLLKSVPGGCSVASTGVGFSTIVVIVGYRVGDGLARVDWDWVGILPPAPFSKVRDLNDGGLCFKLK
jgi:hypothetical protein